MSLHLLQLTTSSDMTLEVTSLKLRQIMSLLKPMVGLPQFEEEFVSPAHATRSLSLDSASWNAATHQNREYWEKMNH